MQTAAKAAREVPEGDCSLVLSAIRRRSYAVTIWITALKYHRPMTSGVNVDASGPSGKEPDAGPKDVTSRVGSLAERHFTGLTVLLALASGFVTFLSASRSAFRDDDFLNLGEARASGMSFDHLFQPVTDVHVMPIHRLLNWLLLTFGPDITVSSAMSALMIGAAVLLLSFAIRSISGSALMAMGVCALLATSSVILRVGAWWTEAAGEFAALAFSGALMLAAMRWVSHRTKSGLVLNALLLLACIFSFDKYLTVVLPVSAVIVLGLTDERRLTLGGLRSRVRECLPLLLVYAGVVLAYLAMALWLILNRTNPFLDGEHPAGPSTWAHYLLKWWETAVFGTVTNSHLGQRWGWCAGAVIFVLLALLTVRGSRSAVIWLAAMATIFANAVVLGVGRLASAGIGILTLDPRFQDLTLLALALLVPAAWRASGSPKPSSRTSRVVAIAFASLVAVAWVMNGYQARHYYLRLWNLDYARAYAENLRTSLERLSREHPDLTILSAAPPAEVVGIGGSFTDTPSVAAVVAPDVAINESQPAGTVVEIRRNGIARVVRTSSLRNLQIGRQRCANSTPNSLFSLPGSKLIAIRLPRKYSRLRLTRTVLVTTRFTQANGVGFVGLAYGMKNGVAQVSHYRPLGGNRQGLRAISPAYENLFVAVWGGAGLCLQSASAALVN